MTLLYSYITDNLYISKLQPSKPIECHACITACSRAGRWGRYWCDFTLHCTAAGSNSRYMRWLFFLCFIKPSKVSQNTTDLQFWMPLVTSGPWSMWGCHGLCLSLFYPNMTCWSLHRWVGSNKSWKQRRSSLRRLWPKISWWREILFFGVFFCFFALGGGVGTLTYNTNISESYIYAGMIHLNTHMVI